MIPGNATLNNSALLVVDVINSCAAEEYEDQERDINELYRHDETATLLVKGYEGCIQDFWADLE